MSPSSITRAPVSWCGFAPFGPDADDGEVDPGMAVLQQELGEVGRDVGLLPAGEPELEDVPVRGVRGGSGRRHARQLLGVLDRAEHRQRLGHRHVARSGEALLQAEHVHRPGGVGDRRSARRVEERRGRGVRVAAVGPVVQRERPGARRALGVGALSVGTISAGSCAVETTSIVSRSVIAIGT